MDPYSETFNTWNKIAAVYRDKFMDLELYNDSYDLFCSYLSKPQAGILDVACGPGNITRYLLHNHPDYKILGTDIAPNMLKIAGEINPSARFTQLDSRQIHLLEPGFDGIICGFGLPYLSTEDTGTFIKHCSDLLNEKGVLYLSFVEGAPDQSGYVSNASGDRCFFFFHTLSHIQEHLARHHFHVYDILHITWPAKESEKQVHTVLIAQKTTDRN